jgi:hypothetical protein
MLIKILPNQVVDHWDILSYGIQQSLPPITIESLLLTIRIVMYKIC